MNVQENKFLAHKISQLDFIDSKVSLEKIKNRQSHQYCMICGTQSASGLQLNFYVDQNGVVWATAKGSIHQQGYKGILHGGFVAGLLDAAMCQVVFSRGVDAVTADMTTRYFSEIPHTSQMIIRSKILKQSLTLYKIEAEIYVEQQLAARSNARFMKRK